MKKMLSLCLVVVLLILPAKALADSQVLNDNTTNLEARNQAFSSYLSENLTEEAAYDPELRAQIIENFFSEHPEYDYAIQNTRSQLRTIIHPPQEIETVTVFNNETQTSDTKKNGTELYVTYYDDGSFVFGTLTYSQENNA